MKKESEDNHITVEEKEKPSQFEALHKHLDEVKDDLTNQINPLQTAFANYRRDTSPDASLWDIANSNREKSKLDKLINELIRTKTVLEEPTD